MIARPPQREVAIPPAVSALAAGATIEAVWENQIGGITFELSGRRDRRFVTWTPARSSVDPRIEADRLSWAAAFTPVPEVLGYGGDETGTWLVTGAVPGDSAVSKRWRSHPRVAVATIGEGLRALHDSLPFDRCPFTWSADDRLADARRRATLGRIDPATWHEDHRGLSVDLALGMLDEVPPVDRVVVCHGDACAPNTFGTSGRSGRRGNPSLGGGGG